MSVELRLTKPLTLSGVIVAVLLSANSALPGPYEDAAAAFDRRDYSTAFELLRKAADQGEAKGQLYLAIFYERGTGVLQDYLLAHMWGSLAAAHGDAETAQVAAKLRDDVAVKMTPAQIAEAQRLAREWKPTK
jgi:TPR repeat protein